MADSSRPRLLPALVGATATGKTELALKLCETLGLPVEVVSLDSRQIYRHLELGTGKPCPDELARLPHHLIDIIDPDTGFSAGRYRREVEDVLPGLWERGVVPLLVGGSGFYLRALTHGLLPAPADGDQLLQLRAQLRKREVESLWKELEGVDPGSAERLHPHDRYRIERALEFFHLSGKSMTQLQEEFEPQPVLGCELSVFHLQIPRWGLHARIAERCEAWLEGNWVEETQGLLDAGWAPDSPGLSILGYREIVAMLAGQLAKDNLMERIVVATRRYARQQEVWFRKAPAIARGTPDDPRFSEALVATLREAAARGGVA